MISEIKKILMILKLTQKLLQIKLLEKRIFEIKLKSVIYK
jgi:hypothetical protein